MAFAKEFSVLIVAVVALVQPWLWWAYRRWWRAGKLELYETGSIELGYTSSGPFVGLWGTLRAVLEDVFVTKMELQVTREADNATHKLEWAAFRATVLSARPEEGVSLEIPYSFHVLKSESRAFSIAFRAALIEREIYALLQQLTRAWFEEPINVERREMLEARGNIGMEFAARADKSWKDFMAQRLFAETYAEVQRRCYWEPGDYQLAMKIETVGRGAAVERVWHFRISKEQAKSLRLNAVTIAQQSCGEVRGPSLNLVYVDYESSDEDS